MAHRSEPQFLGRIDPELAAELEAHGVRRRYPEGAVLFVEGDDAHGVLIVLDGRVKVSVVSLDGKELILGFRGRGEILGELSAVDGCARSTTATVVEPTELVVLPLDTFRTLLERDARLAMALLHTVVARVRDASARQLELATEDALGRVCRRIAELMNLHGAAAGDGSVVVSDPPSQEELAQWAGLSRDGVVRALRTLRRLGWVETGRRRLRVVQPDAVVQRARVDRTVC